jgi:hypothetical protein
MTRRYVAAAKLVSVWACLTGLAISQAQAQFFSNKDGYTADGKYQVQLEVVPYIWLPATSGSVGFASPRLTDRTTGNFSTGVPSLSKLANSLHGAFMGAGVLRYGPYSGEIDIQYIDASESKTLFTGPNGGVARVNASASLVRVAPGVGYQVYSGQLFGIATSADARVGFAYFSSSQSLKGEADLTGETSSNDSFVQPWLGGRLSFIPAPRWRVELGALAQGFGVDGGSWGWGASLIGSYAMTKWATLNLGFRALDTERTHGDRDTLAASRRSLSLTAYGPIAGVGFRF